MYCKSCGNKLQDEDNFCRKCGNNIDSTSTYEEQETNLPKLENSILTAQPEMLNKKYDSLEAERIRLAKEKLQREADIARQKEKAEAGGGEREIFEMASRKELFGKFLHKSKRIAVLGLLLASIGIISSLSFTKWIPTARYNQAAKFFKEERYGEAATQFESLNGFLNSNDLAKEAQYLHAQKLLEEGSFSAALDIYSKLGSFQDSPEKLKEASYLLAIQELNKKSYQKAVDLFKTLGDYKESTAKGIQARYLFAEELFAKEDYLNSFPLYIELDNHMDSKEKSQEAGFMAGTKLVEEKKYNEAIDLLKKVPKGGIHYKEMENLLTKSILQVAQKNIFDKEFEVAQETINQLTKYSREAQVMKNEISYEIALRHEQAGRILEAIREYELAGDYKDSKAKAEELIYAQAAQMELNGDIEGALEQYKKSSHKDSRIKYQTLAFQLAQKTESEGNLEKAADYYYRAGGYQDSYNKGKSIYLALAKDADDNEEYDAASEYYNKGGDSILASKFATYDNAIKAFNSGDYEECHEWLYEMVNANGKLVPFKDAIPYYIYTEVMVQEQAFFDIPELVYELYLNVKKYSDFKDMSKFLEDDRLLWGRIFGKWESEDFRFRLYNDTEGVAQITYNIPSYSGKFYKVENNLMKFGSGSNGWKNNYKFTLLDNNTLKIYSYKADKNYVLYRK